MRENYSHEEKSLKDIIDVLMRRRRIILWMTVLSALIGLVLNFIVLKPVYESTGSYIIKPIEIQSAVGQESRVILSAENYEVIRGIDNHMLGTLARQLNYPQFDLNALRSYLGSSEYLEFILEAKNVDLARYDYTKRISVQLDEKTGVFSIRVKHGDPIMATQIRDSMISELPDYISGKANMRFKDIEKFIVDEIEAEQKFHNELRNKALQAPPSSVTGTTSSDEDRLMLDFRLSEQTLDALELIQKEFKVLSKVDFEQRMNIEQVTDDRLPLRPISPKKTAGVGLSGLLGVIIGMFAALVCDYLAKNFGEPMDRTFNDGRGNGA